jgi:hypothetical protein
LVKLLSLRDQFILWSLKINWGKGSLFNKKYNVLKKVLFAKCTEA